MKVFERMMYSRAREKRRGTGTPENQHERIQFAK